MNRKKIEQNLAVREPIAQRKLFGGGIFGEFEWMPDAYDNCKISILIYTIVIIHQVDSKVKNELL